MRLRFALFATLLALFTALPASAATSPLDAIRLYFASRDQGAPAEAPVHVISMQQSGDAIIAHISVGQSGAAMYLQKDATGNWQVIGGSGGGPATSAQMMRYGIAPARARTLAANRGASLIRRGQRVTVHPLSDVQRLHLVPHE